MLAKAGQKTTSLVSLTECLGVTLQALTNDVRVGDDLADETGELVVQDGS